MVAKTEIRKDSKKTNITDSCKEQEVVENHKHLNSEVTWHIELQYLWSPSEVQAFVI